MTDIKEREDLTTADPLDTKLEEAAETITEEIETMNPERAAEKAEEKADSTVKALERVATIEVVKDSTERDSTERDNTEMDLEMEEEVAEAREEEAEEAEASEVYFNITLDKNFIYCFFFFFFC